MKIKKRNDVDPKEGVNKYGDVKFADPVNKKYPLDDEEHIRSAWNYINKEEDASKYSPAEVAHMKREIISEWKAKIDKAGPPSATQAANAAYAFNFSGEGVPSQIMYMPAGKSTILPTVNGEPKEITVEVDASTAEILQDNLEQLLAQNVEPFLDFDHKAGSAAAWPKSFKWVEGKGVYLELEWSAGGQKSIEGKEYRYFSPSFLVGEDGKPVGLPDSGPIGALTNNPAFREIQRIAASRTKPGASAVPNDDTDTIMSAKIKQVLVDHGLLNAEDMDKGDDEIVPKLKKNVKKLKDDSDANIKAANDMAEEAKAELAQLRDESAETVVMAAIGDGKLPPKSEETKKFYVESFKRDPKGTKAVLAALPVNPALQRLVHVDGTDRRDAKSVDRVDGTGKDLVAAQRAVINELKAKMPGASADDVFKIAAAQRPELFPPDN